MIFYKKEKEKGVNWLELLACVILIYLSGKKLIELGMWIAMMIGGK